MSSEQSMDVNILEKIGDALSAFSEGTARFLTRLLGSSNERHIRKLGYIRARDNIPVKPPGISTRSRTRRNAVSSGSPPASRPYFRHFR